MAAGVRRHSFTVDEFAKMGEAGIFTEDDRVELIDGEIREMGPIGSLHAGTVNRLTVMLIELLGRSAIVGVQNPVQLDLHTEPLPDIAILTSRDDYYTGGHPEPGTRCWSSRSPTLPWRTISTKKRRDTPGRWSPRCGSSISRPRSSGCLRGRAVGLFEGARGGPRFCDYVHKRRRAAHGCRRGVRARGIVASLCHRATKGG